LSNIELPQDIGLISNHLSPVDLRERLSVAAASGSGAIPADSGARYETAAIVPDGQWRALTDTEFNDLASAGSAEPRFFANIGLMRSDPTFAARLEHLVDLQARHVSDGSLRRSPSDIRAKLLEAIAETQDLRPVGPMLAVGRSISRGGLHTTTVGESGERTGMHVDSWDGLDLNGRRQASNRLALNLSEAPRYLLFVPRQIASMIPQLASRRRETGLDLVQAYFSSGCDGRIYRLEVRPGEYYVAPTENLLHDGSSSGMAGDDKVVMARGFVHIEQRQKEVADALC
jgi:hypothetical protein